MTLVGFFCIGSAFGLGHGRRAAGETVGPVFDRARCNKGQVWARLLLTDLYMGEAKRF